MYFQSPALHKDRLLFVANDALWCTSLEGGPSYRLTEHLALMHSPAFSEDGKTIAFSAQQNVYCLSSEGGIPECVAILDHNCSVIGWRNNQEILFSSSFRQAFRMECIYSLSVDSGAIQELPIGAAAFVSFGPHGSSVLQRHGYGYASWKRYQGGTAGKLWIDREGDGNFLPLLPHLAHNIMRPLWIRDRIYFLSDYEGKGNLYSCSAVLSADADLQRHTHHNDFYVRQNAAHGDTIVYKCGGDLYAFNTITGKDKKIPIQCSMGALGKVRKSKNPASNLTSYALSAKGEHLALATRGRLFHLTPQKGPVLQRGKRDGVRYRLVNWLHDGKLLVLCDEGVKEAWEVYSTNTNEMPTRYEEFKEANSEAPLDWGRIVQVKTSPFGSSMMAMNHRHQLIWFCLESKTARVVDISPKGAIPGYDWSPCGQWVVYGRVDHEKGSSLWVYDVVNHERHLIMDAMFSNTHPVFDREGKSIYFLSTRTFRPQYDELHFSLSFKNTRGLFALTLRAEDEVSFVKPLLGIHEEEEQKEEQKTEGSSPAEPSEASAKEPEKTMPERTRIDVLGIEKRLLAFPLPPRAYTSLATLAKGQVLYTVSCEKSEELYIYDCASLKEELLLPSVQSYELSKDAQWMTLQIQDRLRTVAAGSKPDDSDTSYRAGGWLDWDRVNLKVSPQQEWIHMFDEAWRLQRDLFWTPCMGQIDWEEVHQRYRPLLDEIACDSEFQDLLRELQGELGTSHAYVMGKEPKSSLGYLGAELEYDDAQKAYRIVALPQSDFGEGHPLLRPGLGLKVGHWIWSMGGQPFSGAFSLQEYLEDQAGNAISLEISDTIASEKRKIIVFPMHKKQDAALRYRQWVETNRTIVHEKSGGKAGYIHIPDMSLWGYGEFLRSYLSEFDKEGLVIDIRFNGGGNLSGLILDFLTRKRLGYDQTRHFGTQPYPQESPKGPMVAIANEYAGSDGDIFAHSFKTMGLGPLIGKRTWGGVVGIWTRYGLLDGTMTSQPEFSFWFDNVGWRVENHGVDPTIEVDITPQEYRDGKDPQLERALLELSALIASQAVSQRERETPPSIPCLLAPKL